MITPPRKNLRPLAALFRGPFLRRVARHDHVSTFQELLAWAPDDRVPSAGAKLGEFFDYFYLRLVEDYRCEYVFKNAVANATAFSDEIDRALLTGELAVAESRVDVAVINGTSSGFEIKTELDAPTRLDRQLQDYRKLFDKIYVIVPPRLAPKYEKITPRNIGIVTLSSKGSLDTLRESESHKAEVSPAVIFDCLRKTEYTAIITERFGDLPVLPNSLIYQECKRLFCKLLPFEAHDAMVSQLRKRAPNKTKLSLIQAVPPSLKLAALMLSGTQCEFRQLLVELNKPFNPNENIPPLPARQTERAVRAA